ncbi:hypothetical protein [Bacillus sp. JCM 19041]|uniref:hypothetical protein n=1 Tax=Bacillus sp. JCM 19041 TaxID=1460637 RepID=UPI0006D29026
MVCKACGATLSAGDAFCSQCNQVVSEGATIGNNQAMNNEQQRQVASENASTAEVVKQKNETIEKASAASKSYWNYLLSSLMKPSDSPVAKQKETAVFGAVTIVLLALFFGLSIYIQFGIAISEFLQMSFSETFIPGFFYLLVMLSVVVGALFLGLKLFMQVNITFLDVLSSYGKQLTVPLLLMVGAAVMSLIRVQFIYSLLVSVTIVSFVGSTALVFYALKGKSSKRDPFYGLLGVYAVILLVIGLTSDWVFSQLFGGLFF